MKKEDADKAHAIFNKIDYLRSCVATLKDLFEPEEYASYPLPERHIGDLIVYYKHIIEEEIYALYDSLEDI